MSLIPLISEVTNNLDNEVIKEMANLGVIFGHKKSKTHPKMKPFIGGQRNEIALIDPEVTLDKLSKAISFLNEKISQGGLILLVGTSSAAKDGIQRFASEFKFPYVISRWLGGTLTNFKVINQRLSYYQELKAKKESGEFSKYTKKEQLHFSEQIKKMAIFFDGLENLKKIPDGIIIFDIKEHETALREARQLGIPIIAIVDTDDDPTLVDYPIFASDRVKPSIEWVIGKIIAGVTKPNTNI